MLEVEADGLPEFDAIGGSCIVAARRRVRTLSRVSELSVFTGADVVLFKDGVPASPLRDLRLVS